MNKLLKRLLILSILVLFPFISSAYTSPGSPVGFVNDFARIIDPLDRSKIESYLSEYKDQKQSEIVVVTVSSIGDEYLESYANKLFSDWGIGNKSDNNGLLLLIVRDSKEVRIEVGYGLEPYITDALSSKIINNQIIPAFKEGKFGQGILNAVNTITGILDSDSTIINSLNNTNSTDSKAVNFNPLALFVFGSFVLTSIAGFLGRTKSWWLGGVLGAIIGIVIGIVFSSLVAGIIWLIILGIFGLVFDYLFSKSYRQHKEGGGNPPWWLGGGGHGGFSGGGGFGGFGGGMSGGGGASGRW